MFLFELGSAIVVGIGMQAKQDAWLAVLIGMLNGIPLFLIYVYLFYQFQGLSLTSYLPKILGKAIGLPLSYIYILYFLYISSRVLRDFGDLLITSTLDLTPLYVVNGLMIALVAYGVYSGIEVIGKTAEMVFILMVTLGFLTYFFTLISGLVKLENLSPILENGWKPILSTVYKQTYTFPFGEMIVFTMFLPYLNKPHLGKKAGIYAIFSTGMILSLTIAIEISILGVLGVSESQFPLLETITKVNIANFIQRVDVIVVATLIFGVFIKIMVFFYAGLAGIVDIFHISKNKHRIFCILLLSIFILVYSIKMASSFTEHIEVGLKWVPLYLHLPLQTGVPGLLFVITLIRKSLTKNKLGANEAGRV